MLILLIYQIEQLELGLLCENFGNEFDVNLFFFHRDQKHGREFCPQMVVLS